MMRNKKYVLEENTTSDKLLTSVNYDTLTHILTDSILLYKSKVCSINLNVLENDITNLRILGDSILNLCLHSTDSTNFNLDTPFRSPYH